MNYDKRKKERAMFMNTYQIDWKQYAAIARQAVAEGCVLLKNDNNALPLKKGECVSVFGRIQFDYYKSGTGSGGAVNTRYVTGILDALKQCPDIKVNEKLESVYREWVETHPFDKGNGWAQEPWCQEEMSVSETLAKEAAAQSDAAVVIIGRTAGEDKDNTAKEGSYLLTSQEENLLKTVCTAFSRVIVLLNVGNIIDMKWVKKYNPAAVLYVWQGGQEGGSGVVDILTGEISPSGKLSDTIAYDIMDYPSTEGFGDPQRAIYHEDIYVGYRYFETFSRDKVLYPFGFGLSYTDFKIECIEFSVKESDFTEKVLVTNIGNVPGKEVIQIYAEAPQGVLGKATRSLCAFAKTKNLQPGQSETLEFVVPFSRLSSYDDSGITGFRSAYVLEPGRYTIYTGNSIRNAAISGTFSISETKVLEQLTEACSPVTPFDRIHPVSTPVGYRVSYEPVSLRTYSMKARSTSDMPISLPFMGDQGWKLGDVLDGKTTLDTFLSQIPDEDLICLVRGEGMNSPKVTPGTGAAFGGVTDGLLHFGIPVACCSDGPSGIRMDCGTHAFSLPNGTCLACTFNTELVEDLFEMEGLELRRNRVDLLLGPGMNIHRNPLNGRNFEYFSEDPLLTGKMAAAQLRGMYSAGTSGTIKHFAGNNQEFARNQADAVISERALREIYLKGFEIAVKEGGALSIMSTYGPVNGLWTAGSYDLLTTILRKEWGFDGLVMTDWWAKMNDEGRDADTRNTTAMVRAQNDVYMVVSDAASNSGGDNTMKGLAAGRLTRGELVRSARNICSVLMRLPVMDRFLGRIPEEELRQQRESAGDDAQFLDLEYQDVDVDTALDISGISTEMGASTVLGIRLLKDGHYTMQVTAKCEGGSLAQVPMSVFMNHGSVITFTFNGTDGKWETKTAPIGEFRFPHQYMRFYFAQAGLELGEVRIRLERDL